ncbi:MAG: HlyD family efflux transporter periplasmic adaptor subunit, partial [bacterium]|nr:HlyD family efflux transporter periplasmic adaptor subunit [bacterium]
EGETVSASFSSPTFVTIIDLRRLEVQTYVDETDIGRISPGQEALFTVDTFPDTDFKGTVTAIYPKAEIQNNVVNYITIVKMIGTNGNNNENIDGNINENDNGKTLRPEMTTTVTILLNTRNNVLTVPTKAIRREGGRKYVYIVENKDTPPTRRWIKPGWKDKYYTEIIEGLKENQNVILGDYQPE